MRPVHVALALVVVTTFGSLALAQSDAGAPVTSNGRPHAPAERAEPVPPTAPAPAPGAAAVPTEGEGEEPEKPALPAPHPPKAPALVRVPVVQKDGMVRVPGGRFTMGSSDKAAPANERPARSVVVPPFWIDKTEVTVGAYRACVDRGACARPPKTSTVCTYDLGDAALPVSCITWALATAYCHAVAKRLPAEAEWELAARGPTPVRYPWGGQRAGCFASATLTREATQRSCAGKHPWKVGSHPAGASPFGVLDMSGNVEEWVADWYAESASETSPRAGASHVLRGGGWMSPPSQAKTTSRSWGSIREAGPNVGFRCARDD
jgi:formylglycine-generating enzyme required for sulfatase activity